MNLLGLELLISVGLFIVTAIFQTYSEAKLQGTNGRKDVSNKAEVELLIVCDKEFSERFQQDHERIVDHLALEMDGVTNMFKSLISSSIAFRVTSLHIINDTTSQPFIEQSKNSDGSISLMDLYTNFGKWVYSFETKQTGFDIALLVTGAEVTQSEKHLINIHRRNSACSKDDDLKIFTSSIIYHSPASRRNTCGNLGASFASILGSPEDEETHCFHYQFLTSTRLCDGKQYALSECTDAGISRFLSTGDASCLKVENAPTTDILKFSSKLSATNEKCNTSREAFSTADLIGSRQCVFKSCPARKEDSQISPLKLHPFQNNSCENSTNTLYFRGCCQELPKYLKNMWSEKCLDSNPVNNSEEGKLVPVMANCGNASVHRFLAVDVGAYMGTYVTTNISNADKCLSLDTVDKNSLSFVTCTWSAYELLGWDLRKIENMTEFLLIHRQKNSCLRVDENGKLNLTELCAEDDPRMRWTFLENSTNFHPNLKPAGLTEEHNAGEDYGETHVVLYIVMYTFGVFLAVFAIFLTQRHWKRKNAYRPVSYDRIFITDDD